MHEFAEYVHTILKDTAFEPDFNKPEEQIFAASLASFRGFANLINHAPNEVGQSLNLHCGFVERMSPNAFADHVDGVHYIGMHQALMVTIIDLCLLTLTQSNIFPEIGEAQNELSPKLKNEDEAGLFLLKTTIDGQTINKERDHVRVPKCEHRHVAAVYLSVIMSRFVWFHEFAHCELGHVLYVQNKDIARRVNEVADTLDLVAMKRQSSQITELRHAFEFDADLKALVTMLHIEANGLENMDGIKALPEVLRLTFIIFGSFIMTWLFDEYEAFSKNQHGISHPRPRARLEAIRSKIPASYADIAATAWEYVLILSESLPKLKEYLNKRDVSVDDTIHQGICENLRFSRN